MIPALLLVALAAGDRPARVDMPASALAQHAPAPAAQRPPRADRPDDARAQAYYEFILGRYLDNEGKTDAALAAYKRALALDPASAEIHVELATVYARQGDVEEATRAAEAALRIDPANVEAHRLLGLIAAEDAERDTDDAARAPDAQAAARVAIGHLEQALAGARIDLASSIRLALGRLYLQTQQADKAVAVVRQALVDEPGVPQGTALLAEAYTRAGQRQAAIALLQDAVKRDPRFYASLGEAYEEDERWKDAAAAYALASANAPRDAELKTRWAAALLNTDDDADTRQACDLLTEVTRANPTRAWALYLLARAHRQAGDLEAAEAAARRLLALSPANVSAAHTLAQILAEQRAFGEVVAALAPMIDRVPKERAADRAVLLTDLGFAYLETNRLPDALAAFEQALALDPEDATLPVYYGQALNAAKEFDKALALVRPRRAASPTDVRLARVEADALRGQGKVDAGAAILSALADQPTASVVAIQSLGEYLASARRYADAAGVLKRAVRSHPDDLDVAFQYAAMLERQKLFGDAEREFRAVLARDPEHAPTLNYLGYMLAERGERLTEAFEFVSRAVALDPHNGAYLDSLGWTCFRLGRLDDAERHLRAAAGQLPRDSVVQDHWGDLLARRGRRSEAVSAWRLSLAGDGEGIDRAAIERKIKAALDAGR